MKRILFLLISLLALSVYANDGVFTTNGSQLVPIEETDIQLKKEVLTISLLDNGKAEIDVQYTLYNPGQAKTLCVGFESETGYNIDVRYDGVNPSISKFNVVMNGKKLPYKNAMTKRYSVNKGEGLHIERVNSKMVPKDEEDYLFLSDYSYTYYFDATFVPGTNTIHHTYIYDMSYSVCASYELVYSLTPAKRWAGGSIGDFTLIIKAENTVKHFLMDEAAFGGAPRMTVTSGMGKYRGNTFVTPPDDDDPESGSSYTEICIRNGAIEYHSANFKPEDELFLVCDPCKVSYDEKFEMKDNLGYFYDPRVYSIDYMSTIEEDEKPAIYKDVMRNLPFAARGYVFKRQDLRNYFSKQWWYMPDPNYKADVKSLTKQERERIEAYK